MTVSPRKVVERYSDGFRGGDHDQILACPTDDPLATLSPRERDVLALVAEGRSNKAIGDRLHIADRTVPTSPRSSSRSVRTRRVTRTAGSSPCSPSSASHDRLNPEDMSHSILGRERSDRASVVVRAISNDTAIEIGDRGRAAPDLA